MEVGCGLGEILRHVKAPKRYGYDINPHVIEAAKAISGKKDSVQYFVGGLENVEIQDIDCLMAISWMHGVPEAQLKEWYRTALERNNAKHIIVDVKDKENEKKDFSRILPSCYHRIARKGYRAVECKIWIEVWECKDIHK